VVVAGEVVGFVHQGAVPPPPLDPAPDPVPVSVPVSVVPAVEAPLVVVFVDAADFDLYHL